jgi:hypothetical protein
MVTVGRNLGYAGCARSDHALNLSRVGLPLLFDFSCGLSASGGPVLGCAFVSQQEREYEA